MDFEFSPGLAALAGIIPLTIVYLLKPRPKKFVLPTLMFVQRIGQNVLDARRKLSNRINDPLFFLQLLTLIFIAFALAGPMVDDLAGDSRKVIFIIDSSASMSSDGRIEAAQEIAINNLGRKNTIIAAESIPMILAESLDAADAKEVLSGMEARNTGTDIPKTVLAVIGEKESENGKVIVISDFENWDGKAPETYVNIARTKNIELEFKQVGEKTPNYAIIAGHLTDRNDGTYEYTCTVKNFNDKSTKLDVRLESKSELFPTQKVRNSVTLGKYGTQQITFSNIRQGTSTVKILNKDAVPCDNSAYISIPEITPKRILVLTDQDPAVNRSALLTAVSLMQNTVVDVHYKLLDGLPSDYTMYDTIIVNCKYGPLPSKSARKIADYAKSGKELVVIGNGCLYNCSEMHGLYPVLPVSVKSFEEEGSHTVEAAGSGKNIFEDVTFEEIYVRKFLTTTPKEDAVVLAELKGAGKDTGPMVSTWNIYNGTTAYVGFSDAADNDPWNNFHTMPTYPVFWAKLLKYIWGVGEISETNVRTGRYQPLEHKTRIGTPTETVSSDFAYYDECGFYSLDQKTIAANLYDPLESNTYTSNRLHLEPEKEEDLKQEIRTQSPYKARKYLIYALLLLLVIENLIMFRRRII
ncbi:hypothetical protein MSMTP_2088 [Methanosarcina sp. MTP4]|uniref:DUF7408 domain-containing protein n=1 Tax=Methanosarcina sp. MTP4 TaxID=1434100 RepID=UPI000615827F|nr:BatA domain-containing protein [Methanosarcina sp. MTP4]AKB25557.1 hypothetical protein MSMTP_2088 [Methanosarcina sp. MTP4]